MSAVFRIVNGKPDLGADSVDTLEYIALREILKDDPDKPVRDVDLRDGHYIVPGDPAKAKTGYLEAAYQVGDGTPTVQRFQFIKDQDAWRVLRVLGAGQIAEAHPHETPTAESAPEKQMIYQTAARLEKDVVKNIPAKGIYGAEFTAKHNDKNRLGVCEVSYRPLPGRRTGEGVVPVPAEERQLGVGARTRQDRDGGSRERHHPEATDGGEAEGES